MFSAEPPRLSPVDEAELRRHWRDQAGAWSRRKKRSLIAVDVARLSPHWQKDDLTRSKVPFSGFDPFDDPRIDIPIGLPVLQFFLDREAVLESEAGRRKINGSWLVVAWRLGRRKGPAFD